MSKNIIILIVVIISAILLYKLMKQDAVLPHGEYLFADGNIKKINFVTKEVDIILKQDDQHHYTNLFSIDENNLLVGWFGKKGHFDNFGIYNIKQQKLEPFAEKINIEDYNKERGKIILREYEDGVSSLYISNLDLSEKIKITDSENMIKYLGIISNDQIAFCEYQGDSIELFLYSVIKHTITINKNLSDIYVHSPILFLNEKEFIIHNKNGYFIADINGKRSPINLDFTPQVYLKDISAVIGNDISWRWFPMGETFPIKIYFFDTKKTYTLFPNELFTNMIELPKI